MLKRLVALNAERQAEEAAGHVRYLRPAFQAPGEVTQGRLAIAVPGAAAEAELWPAETKDCVPALRRVLREAARPLSVEAVARRFEQAPRAAVADLLDTFAGLGQTRRADAVTSTA